MFRLKNKRSNVCSASYQISLSATSPMQLRSRRSKSSSLPGGQPIDPFTFVGVGILAGFQQATNAFPGYGQGAQGYGKRFGADYANVVAGTFIGSAILPSLLKQDPRYFYKGTGSSGSRLLYALANTVICKGDNQRWQPNYSGMIGSFATGGISSLYYPASDRNATQVVIQNSLIRMGETTFANVLQEFVVRKLTPRLQTHSPVQH